MYRSPLVWPAVIVLSALGAGVAVYGALGAPLRPLFTLWFILVCPGMAFIRLLRLRTPVAEWTLAIALSLALDTIVTMILLYSGAASAEGALIVLIAISLAGVGLQVMRVQAV